MNKNKSVLFVSLFLYLTGSMPIQCICSENDNETQNMARDLLAFAETNADETVSHTIKKLEEFFKNTPNAFDEGEKFIRSFVNELNLRYRTQLTIADAYVLIRNNFGKLNLSQEQQEGLLTAVNLYESRSSSISQSTSEISAETHISKNSLLIPPLLPWFFFGLNKSKHSKTKSNHITATVPSNIEVPSNVELELPSKMAIGFACALAGALLCIVPGAQGVGLWMIAAGATLALDGLAEDERPYYRNLDTGEIIPFGNLE